MQDETLVIFGGSVKALDDKGNFGGYLVLFGTPDATDASPLRDYFTKDTDFGLDLSTKSRILYGHGMDPTLGLKKLGTGPGSLKVEDPGVWLAGQLNLRDEYEAKIFGMVKEGKLGFSSGTASHLIRREKQANGANKILTWPLGLDASLTPTPAEPRTQAVALKSLSFDGIKGEHLGPYSEHAAAMAGVRSIHGRLTDAVYSAMADDKATNAGKLRKIKAAHDEARDGAVKMIAAMLPAPPATEGSADAATKDLDLFELQFHARAAELDELLAGV